MKNASGINFGDAAKFEATSAACGGNEYFKQILPLKPAQELSEICWFGL